MQRGLGCAFALTSLALGLATAGCGDAATPATTTGSATTGSTTTGSTTGSGTTGGASATGDTSNAGSGAVMCQPETNISPASTSAEAACRSFCDEQDHCDDQRTAEDCYVYRRCDQEDIGSADCVASAAKYYDCLRAQTDICEPGACCDDQATAVQMACSGG